MFMKQTSSRQAVRAWHSRGRLAASRAPRSNKEARCSKWVLSIQKCAEQSGQDRFVRKYRETIRTPSSKVGKKGMCEKGHGQE